MMHVEAIPAFNDNYIWAIHDTTHCLIVDPGDAAPVSDFLASRALALSGILVTHHHPDHVAGISALTSGTTVPVYGPANEQIPGRTHALTDGDKITLPHPASEWHVLAVPGHTLGHLAYYTDLDGTPCLFCGDTLFVGGCGRLFEGTPEQMYHSLQRLAALPDATRVYCAHEYTLANLAFAHAAYPNHDAITQQYQRVTQLRERGDISVPSTLAVEKDTNPFLLAANTPSPGLTAHNQDVDQCDPVSRFAALRDWKDRF